MSVTTPPNTPGANSKFAPFGSPMGSPVFASKTLTNSYVLSSSSELVSTPTIRVPFGLNFADAALWTRFIFGNE